MGRGLGNNSFRAYSGRGGALNSSATDTGPAEPASDYEATINWGKGRKAAGMITGSNGQFVVSGKNMFSRFSGAEAVSVTVTDIPDGRTVSVNESASYVVRHLHNSLKSWRRP
jgi:hypothetical protein